MPPTRGRRAPDPRPRQRVGPGVARCQTPEAPRSDGAFRGVGTSQPTKGRVAVGGRSDDRPGRGRLGSHGEPIGDRQPASDHRRRPGYRLGRPGRSVPTHPGRRRSRCPHRLGACRGTSRYRSSPGTSTICAGSFSRRVSPPWWSTCEAPSIARRRSLVDNRRRASRTLALTR